MENRSKKHIWDPSVTKINRLHSGIYFASRTQLSFPRNSCVLVWRWSFIDRDQTHIVPSRLSISNHIDIGYIPDCDVFSFLDHIINENDHIFMRSTCNSSFLFFNCYSYFLFLAWSRHHVRWEFVPIHSSIYNEILTRLRTSNLNWHQSSWKAYSFDPLKDFHLIFHQKHLETNAGHHEECNLFHTLSILKPVDPSSFRCASNIDINFSKWLMLSWFSKFTCLLVPSISCTFYGLLLGQLGLGLKRFQEKPKNSVRQYYIPTIWIHWSNGIVPQNH